MIFIGVLLCQLVWSMEIRKLGKMEVPKLGFGAMGISAFYDSILPDDKAITLLQRVIDLGMTFIDTSDIYGPFTNEEVIGKAIKKYPREKLQIATKFGLNFTESSPRTVRGEAEYVRMSLEASLRRLGTSYIDLYYVHRIDQETPIEETMWELKHLYREGKVKYIGLSEASASTIRRAHAIHPITAIQLEWSLFVRDVEDEIIPTCRELGIGIVPYSPLGRGMLTAKWSKKSEISENDWRSSATAPGYMSEENWEANMKLLEKVKDVAKETGSSIGQVALAWLYQQGDDVVPIPGTTKFKHLLDNYGSTLVTLSLEQMETLSSLGTFAGDRYGPAISTFLDDKNPMPKVEL